LKAHFTAILIKQEEKRLFDGAQNGVLGTFSAKIRMAYALGLLLNEVYYDLLIINGIRNAFAHSLHEVYFDNQHITSSCEKLVWAKRRAEIIEEPLVSTLPVHLFIETVRHVYAAFKRTADRKAEISAALRRVAAEAAQAQNPIVAPAPSQRTLRRRDRPSRPKAT
jgi:hypothetical protein